MMATCILCGNTQGFKLVSEQVRDSDRHKVIKCSECGHVQLTPVPSLDEDNAFYNKNQPSDIEHLRKVREWDTKRRVEFLNFVPKDTRILEVGSGEGFFIAELSKCGYNIIGIELSQSKRDITLQITDAQVLGINLLDSTPDLGKFGVIAAFHLIEHLADPIRFCRKLGQYLTDEGILVLEIPNLDDLMLRTCPEYQAFWWQRAHVSYFNEDSIRYVMNKAGFNITYIHGIQRYGLGNMLNWLVSGKPQLDMPSYEIDGLYEWLEYYYKSYLEATKQSDTLMVIARKEEEWVIQKSCY